MIRFWIHQSVPLHIYKKLDGSINLSDVVFFEYAYYYSIEKIGMELLDRGYKI